MKTQFEQILRIPESLIEGLSKGSQGKHRLVVRSVFLTRNDVPGEIPIADRTDPRIRANQRDIPSPDTGKEKPPSDSKSTATREKFALHIQHEPLPAWMRPTRSEAGDLLVTSREFRSQFGVDANHEDDAHPVAPDRGAYPASRKPLAPHSYGGGPLGLLGVTPIERGAIPNHVPHGATRHLVQAITDYVDERLAKHLADTIRQGLM